MALFLDARGFGFATFWAYIWFCQYLLIWYSNIPEETPYYALRFQGGWSALFWLNPIVTFLVPFVVLLGASAKKRPTVSPRGARRPLGGGSTRVRDGRPPGGSARRAPVLRRRGLASSSPGGGGGRGSPSTGLASGGGVARGGQAAEKIGLRPLTERPPRATLSTCAETSRSSPI
ncbi:MAG: hypothetical protein IPF66_21850 [Holophagales bacterium]|nr:hypothetical protein [Holophagales bacterium]